MPVCKVLPLSPTKDHMKRRIWITIIGWFQLCVALLAKDLPNVDKEGVGLQGYDPVAFYTIKQPVKGRVEFESSHGGARFRFASKKHKELFDEDPEKYAPQFGGWCAYGVSRGVLVPIQIEAWQIVDGRLLMQKSRGVRDDFNEDPSGNLSKADAQWPRLLEKKGK